MKDYNNKHIKLLGEVFANIKKELDRLNCGPASFYFERFAAYADGLFTFSKFKVGDKVILTRDVDIKPDSGWNGCQHFMKKGSPATICEVDWNTHFIYDVKFDNESWIDDKEVEEFITNKHVFGGFREDFFIKADDVPVQDLDNITMYATKINGKIYYLYEKPDYSRFLSILTPEEYCKVEPEAKYLASYCLENDLWRKIS